MNRLAGKKALVTGAASGIGKAIAEALAARGVSVVLADRDLAASAQLASDLGAHAMALELDVTDDAAVDVLLQAIPPAFRPLDILVNNAGHDVGGRTHFGRGPADDWSSIIDTNLDGDDARHARGAARNDGAQQRRHRQYEFDKRAAAGS
jgi:NADP-dependent 3-hydroxy acid dehydrogenase YdfG